MFYLLFSIKYQYGRDRAFYNDNNNVKTLNSCIQSNSFFTSSKFGL